ncbi:hypothetical protein N7451_012210 [Penicillium sp. IBT 35674x]|nr:hypothetical protein N7451_012210 [Penicillium sp. IBT 35674x]
MSASWFRPIQPHLPNTKPPADEPSREDLVQDHSIRRLSAACRECQRRRTKCSSENPCLECTKRGSICIFDMSSDKRRKGYARKLEEELDHCQNFLNDLLRAIRDSDNNSVQHIINTVRLGSSTHEIRFEVNKVLMGKDHS